MFSNYRGSPIIYHAGGISGFSCLYLRIPAEDTSIVMLTNLGGYPCAATGRRLIDAVVPMPRPRRRSVDLPRSSLDDRTGSYTDTINLIEIAAGQGHLVVSQADQVHRMLPIDPATYIAEDDPDIVLRFHDDEPHSPCTLSYPLSWITGYRTGSPARIATAG